MDQKLAYGVSFTLGVPYTAYDPFIAAANPSDRLSSLLKIRPQPHPARDYYSQILLMPL